MFNAVNNGFKLWFSSRTEFIPQQHMENSYGKQLVMNQIRRVVVA